ncbi:MAG TPA: hypothetical protein VMV49_18295 [Candidatus Deferrimicrobium sp.]|nr:hypothetical protein [Candidatus Deferrimicrobium sp.]
MDLIYSDLTSFVQSLKNIFTILPMSKELGLIGQYFALRIEANILVSDKSAYYFLITPNGGYIKRGTRDISLMTLKANQKTWLQILNGQKSLMQEYNRGNVTMSNARTNFMYKLVLLGILFESRNRITRAGRILSPLPLSILRIFLINIFKYTHTILNIIPSSVMQSFLNLITRLSTRFEK